MIKKKGFVFTMDAIFAVIIFSIFSASFFFLSAQAQESGSLALAMKQQAGDALAVLDISGVLSSQNATLMNSTIASSVSPALSYNLAVEYYNYSANGFISMMNISTGYVEPRSASFVDAKRQFISVSNATISYYGVAILRVWQE